MRAGPSERAGFIDAPLMGQAKSASSPTVAPMAMAAACPTARVSVAVAMMTNMRKKVKSVSNPKDCQAPPASCWQGGTQVHHIPQQEAQAGRGQRGSRQLRGPVADQSPHREMPRQHEAERDGRVEVRPADMAERVDQDHDDQPEHQPHPDVRHLPAREGIDHDRATAGEDQPEGANALSKIGRPGRKADSATLGRGRWGVRR